MTKVFIKKFQILNALLCGLRGESNVQPYTFIASRKFFPSRTTAKSSTARKRAGKKLYVAVAAAVAIAVIVAALMVPQGAAIIPLEVNYVVGEKMVYDQGISINMTYMFGNQNATTINSTSVIEVIGFDGEYYTLNNTQTMTLNNKPHSFSILQRMNKTGYSTNTFDIGSRQITTNSSGNIYNSYLTEWLNKSEVKVGDTWQVPLPFGQSSSSFNVTGGLYLTFQGFEDLTVPAGTYRVFRVDMESRDLAMHLSIHSNFYTTLQSDIQMTITGRMYMEYGTLRQIKNTMQEAVNYGSSSTNYNMTMSMEMVLKEHTIPTA